MSWKHKWTVVNHAEKVPVENILLAPNPQDTLERQVSTRMTTILNIWINILFLRRKPRKQSFASGFTFSWPTSCAVLMACETNPVFKMLGKTEYMCIRGVVLQLEGEGDHLAFLVWGAGGWMRTDWELRGAGSWVKLSNFKLDYFFFLLFFKRWAFAAPFVMLPKHLLEVFYCLDSKVTMSVIPFWTERPEALINFCRKITGDCSRHYCLQLSCYVTKLAEECVCPCILACLLNNQIWV